MFDLDFQGHAIKLEFFIITVGFLDPENIPLRNIFEKFGREGKNPGGVVSTPLGVFGWRNTLGICGLITQKTSIQHAFAQFSKYRAETSQLHPTRHCGKFITIGCRLSRYCKFSSEVFPLGSLRMAKTLYL